MGGEGRGSAILVPPSQPLYAQSTIYKFNLKKSICERKKIYMTFSSLILFFQFFRRGCNKIVRLTHVSDLFFGYSRDGWTDRQTDGGHERQPDGPSAEARSSAHHLLAVTEAVPQPCPGD